MKMENEKSGQLITNTPLRIGILGAANIARKNVRAIQHPSNVQSCQLVAIASRSESKATAFLKDHVSANVNVNLGVAHDDDAGVADVTEQAVNVNVKLYTGKEAYNNLINADNVDALYIPLPTTFHHEYVIKALEAGKHVLVEKPVATSCKQYEEMISVAKKNDKYIMDGTMFVHNPRTKHVCEYISSSSDGSDGDIDKGVGGIGGIGNQVLRIDSTFTFSGDEDFFNNNIRVSSNGDPLGCIGDLGWYNIRMAQLAFGSEYDSESNASDIITTATAAATSAQVVLHELNQHGVPIDATCLVTFENKNTANKRKGSKVLSFHCSFIHPLTQTVSIHGSEKSITMEDFVIPRSADDCGGGDKDQEQVHDEGGDKKLSTFEVKSQSLSFADLFSLHSNQIIEESLGGPGPTNTRCPPQEVLMWKNFAQFCRAHDNDNIDGDANDNNVNVHNKDMKKEAYELLKISYENQRVVDALMESIQQNGKKICI